ncbi:uncharacterized protein LOC111873652 isoform X2 [Cryptotermes secundus]|uniref:uncharacterized protein LOC111873652 isoform X2 n=1 Tax=Cryptotermes secundus TaxID=105785 RepID=UPI000CD7B099|nr:uncharacterized protein LOC111873652 isoform X2 [Cryptotermes secundus]
MPPLTTQRYGRKQKAGMSPTKAENMQQRRRKMTVKMGTVTQPRRPKSTPLAPTILERAHREQQEENPVTMVLGGLL